MASSLARPPAFLMIWASPSTRPANFAGSSRASIQVNIANLRAGGKGRFALLPKPAEYLALASRTSLWTLLFSFWRIGSLEGDITYGFSEEIMMNAQDINFPKKGMNKL